MFENSFSFLVHGNATDHNDGAVAYVEKFLSFIDHVLADGPAALMPEFFPGLAVMPNIHPLIVHFPIAFLSAFFVLDLVGSVINNENWRNAASALLYLGVIGVAAAVLAGFQAAENLPHGGEIHEIMESHEHYGLTVAFLSVFLAIWRFFSKSTIKGFANFVHLFFAGLMVLILSLGADLGGQMVYGHGAGVKPMMTKSFRHSHNSPSNGHSHQH
jgi:uncharacterized membrane protein